MNKYIVINSEDIQKRIDDLKKDILISESQGDKTRAAIETFEMKAYEEILSKSKPLTPIIENAFDEGQTRSLGLTKKGYINNLKLDI